MISNDNENSIIPYDLVKEIRSTEVELLKSALIKSKGDPETVANKLGVEVSYIFVKAKELELEEYIQSDL